MPGIESRYIIILSNELRMLGPTEILFLPDGQQNIPCELSQYYYTDSLATLVSVHEK